jgi:hypothetical protein
LVAAVAPPSLLICAVICAASPVLAASALVSCA